MATITEDYVSFETALLLKEKGFEQIRCQKQYNTQGDLCIGYCYGPVAPTLQMAMKWLREVHRIHIAALCPIVDVDIDVFGVKYNVVISNLKNYCLAFNTDIEDNEYDTYEEAIEAACIYALKNLI